MDSGTIPIDRGVIVERDGYVFAHFAGADAPGVQLAQNMVDFRS